MKDEKTPFGPASGSPRVRVSADRLSAVGQRAVRRAKAPDRYELVSDRVVTANGTLEEIFAIATEELGYGATVEIRRSRRVRAANS